MTEPNERQQRQNGVECVITVEGYDDWKSALAVPTTFSDRDSFWIERCGGKEVPYIVYTRECAEVNGDSFERTAVTDLFNLGYGLEELEVEFTHKERKEWGLCKWYKEHPIYSDPPDWAKSMFKNATPKTLSLGCSMWKTENAGDKQFTMLSMQMVSAALLGMNSSILLHKTILYRKVVFSPLKQKQQVAA